MGDRPGADIPPLGTEWLDDLVYLAEVQAKAEAKLADELGELRSKDDGWD